MPFHVFVEGATDDTPAGVARLAEAIANHYGLPSADLLARLQRGRFRVKGNVERAIAEQYRRDLERLGARCTIEEASADPSQRATPLPFPAVRPATPPAGVPTTKAAPATGLAAAGLSAAPSRPSPPSGLAAAAPSRPSTPSGLSAAIPSRPSAPSGLSAAAPSRPSAPSGSPPYQSGLAAAFSGEVPVASLGALERDDVALSLASVDGVDEPPPEPSAFEPPASVLPASIGPPPESASPKPPAKKPADPPVDLFAPPDAQGPELSVDIAADELDVLAKKRAPAAEPVSPPEEPRSSTPSPRGSQASLQVPEPSAAAVPAARGKLGPLGDARVRFVAGVLLAILIGFVPAHVVASLREGSVYKAIDDRVLSVQQLADTPELYATLDQMRADQLDKKRSEQRNIAIMALAVWALVGGGVAFAWFKKVPWERFE